MLVIRLRSLGDSILTLPLLETLSAWRADLELDVLVEAPYAPVFTRHPSVHDVFVLAPKSRPWDAGLPRVQAAWHLRRRHYPAVLNLHGGTTSAFFACASGARIRIGQESYRNAWCYNARIPPASTVWGRAHLHTVEHQMTFPRWLRIPISEKSVGRLIVESSASAQLEERLRRSGVARNGFFLIHPTATLWTKQWPAKNFAELADRLVRDQGLPVVFTAAPHENRVLDEVRSSARVPHLYWSDLDLSQLLAVIEACRLFVGNDSGPTHAASALHKPVVVVWGSSDFVAWRPWSTDFELIRSDLPCIPCPGYTCHAFGNPKCILDISVDRVWKACERILGRTEAGTSAMPNAELLP